MKYLLISFLQLLSLCCFSQDISISDIEQKTIEVNADKGDWISTGLTVKKNDLVFLNVYGKISIGPVAGEVNGAGNRDNPFLVGYSFNKDIPHAALMCSNDDELVFAQYKPDLQIDNPLYDCVSQLSSCEGNTDISKLFTEGFIGNFFQPKTDNEELKLLINDAKYIDNYGKLDVTIIIYHNFFPQVQVGDVIIYWKGNQITHSGYVSTVNNCVVTGITCWYQYTAYVPITGDPYATGMLLSNVNPDTILLTDRFGGWSAYHTERPYQRKIRTILVDGSIIPGAPNGRNNVLEVVTDLGKIIGLNHYYLGKWDIGVYLNNCHGYTFNCQDADKEYYYQIAGYANGNLNTKLEWHTSQNENDQGTAVKYILHDNGYRQVHALGPIGCNDHFRNKYEVAQFTY